MRNHFYLVVETPNGNLVAGMRWLLSLNPVRAGLLPPEDRLLGCPWSSLGWYLAAPEHRPGWLRVERLLGEHRTAKPISPNHFSDRECYGDRSLW